ncbi:MAG: hypothetical protein DAHOPDDO_02398 [Ignavibacteriaceae bacterium]|jgi:Tfp pilus assembly protein FimT|nr:hypothetical protein [Ignavibacteriaceae bacterium]
MEILIGLSFIAIVAIFGYFKFKQASKGKDCCK